MHTFFQCQMREMLKRFTQINGEQMNMGNPP
ncbi:hypothetical protein DEU53_104319 [Pantoea sp. AG1095]|nr:hypothetical protein [Pantoea sp. SORGH_AS_0659]PYG49359.1 hypothetical protein DEU53_104319 [Pantoea sp. AG1095]